MPARLSADPDRLSIIIPTLNEAETLPSLLANLGREADAPPNAGGIEIIVVDGGSRDGTPDLARAAGVRVLETRPGRGGQLRTGAAAATGDTLLFLHADSGFPRGGLARLRQALASEPAAIGGNFRLVFSGTSRFAQLCTQVWPAIRWLTLYYGDSGLFIRRAAYDHVGGFPDYPLMEDYALVRRLERSGRMLCLWDMPLVTSSRRFQGRAPPTIVWGWVYLHLLYHLGVAPKRLAAIYRRMAR